MVSFTSLLSFVIGVLLSSVGNAEIMFGFYNFVCPNAEKVVYNEIEDILSVAPSLAGPLLRTHYHDCFVNGCDASILLNPTANNVTEKLAIPNLSLRGYGVFDRIKLKVEAECPGIVSCADIIALVARDVVAVTKGPYYPVETGRRDGTRSNADDVIGSLLPASSNITALKNIFLQKGLSIKDLVVLSGAHTIGTSHCSAFSSRLYNATGKSDTDPTLDMNYAQKLKSKCKPNDLITIVEMDPGSFRTFDVGYFKQVLKGRSLFLSDEALLHDSETRTYVEHQATAGPDDFFKDFGISMVNMGRIEVLTNKQGEIRKNCGFVN